MIRLDVEQGSDEWRAARIGIPTASCFDRILTPKQLGPSKSAERYISDLCAERLIGEPLDSETGGFMDRGTAMEDEARRWYEAETGDDVLPGGLCLTDDRRAGASPDGLVGKEGGLEIKCPSAGIHAHYLRCGIDAEYRLQIQGGLWVCGLRWWSFVSYSPVMPPLHLLIERDEAAQEALAREVPAFCARLDEAMRWYAAIGALPRPPRPQAFGYTGPRERAPRAYREAYDPLAGVLPDGRLVP